VFGLWRRRLPGLARDAACRGLAPPLDGLKTGAQRRRGRLPALGGRGRGRPRRRVGGRASL